VVDDSQLVFFFICCVVFSTRASPVGIPRVIYRIYLYINVLCIFIYTIVFLLLLLLLLLPVKFYPETGVVTVGHFSTVPVACGRCC
jgi:hypothetical protein